MKTTNCHYPKEKTKKVLIVEARTEIRELLRTTLEWGGFSDLILVSDGSKVLETALREKPTLIIMGATASGEISELEATAILKNHPEFRNKPICLLSANCQQWDIQNGLAAGADAYWEKPFSPVQILDKVRALLLLSHGLRRNKMKTLRNGREYHAK